MNVMGGQENKVGAQLRRRPLGGPRESKEGWMFAMSGRVAVSLLAGAIIVPIAIGMPRLSTTLASQAGTLRETSSMGEARAAHTATSLVDGNVLIVGGFTGDEAHLAGAELFDQQHERFEQLPHLQVMRQSHTATPLRDGRVLIAGGMGEQTQYYDTAYLYDPSTRTFSPTGRMTMARSNHVAILLEDGRVLLAGGTGTGWSFLASAEIYDPPTGTFRATGAMAEPREGHAAVRLQDGRVLVTGGHQGRGSAIQISRTAEIFDATVQRFMPTEAMTICRHKHDAVMLGNGQVLVLGGADESDNEGVYSSVEVYDQAVGEFRSGSPMRLGRYKFRGTSLTLTDGTLLLAGGATRAEVYNPATGKSDIVGGVDQLAGQFSAATLLPGGRVLITGGYGQGRGPRANAWLFESSASNGRPTGR